MDNHVTLVGNTTRDVDLRFTPSGLAVASLGLAVNRRWKDRNSGEDKEEVSFFNVTAWDSLAENVAESLEKGARVIVTGRLKQRSWEDDDGNKRSAVDVIADEISPSLRWATATVVRNERSATTTHHHPVEDGEPF